MGLLQIFQKISFIIVKFCARSTNKNIGNKIFSFIIIIILQYIHNIKFVIALFLY